MPKYLTVQDLAARFSRDDKTIRRWIDEGKDIIDPFTNEQFLYRKDPGGNWIFRVIAITISSSQPEEYQSNPAPVTRLRRRIISSGIKS